ncbi:hypothetical protein DAEQUDRAFT_565047 [Daedalea quercina L-15889]|uniref:MYND-type domain-containing protein n=1 Tax=Daedalea quercina L-15889 TaxID=1314783 RepID=A0A165LX96_9APHY|nr:hypothetical protein DAEQUDRAFT_565047 [Daedalea quercina L-15889]
MNGKLLSTKYEPEKDATEQNFKALFMPPPGPLGYEDIGKLNNDPGCVLCGKKTGSRCKQCMSVFYCGPDCQRADWPHHKHGCRSLQDGRWRFLGVLPETEGMYATRLNRFNLMNDIRANTSPLNSNAIPANVYGDRLFLVKISIRRDEWDSFEIYDRQGPIGVHFIQGEI